MALRLSAAFGDRPGLSMDLQATYDMWQAKHGMKRPKVLTAASMNFHTLLGAFWRIFLRGLMHIWYSIPALQTTRTLQTPSVYA
jgi:hypothetical protein